MARSRGRIEDCTADQARTRLAHAREFLEVAKLAADETDPEMEYGGVAASLAVLSGIAASDAACCKQLGKRSRSQNHRDAVDLLEQIAPNGKQAASHFRQLIDLKDSAHYGFITVTSAGLKQALRQAERLLAFAEEVMQR